MPNPTITPYAGDGAAYTVTQSDSAYYDLEVVDLTDDADFTMTVPANTVQVDMWSKVGAEPTVRWDPAGAQVPLLTAGAWATGSINVAPWAVTIASGASVTDPVIVTINSPGPVGSFRLRIRNLAGASVSLQAQSDTRTVRIVADPSIIGTPGPNISPVVERTDRIMQGDPQVTRQSAAPAQVPAALNSLPVVRGVWEKVTSVPTFTLTQMPPSSAKFKVPGVYADTPFTFRFRAYYDLDNDGAFDATEPETHQDVPVTFAAVHHRMVVVLDRSGSMSGTLPGGAESKWDAVRRAAHIWLDLFAAFRAPANQTAGFITFEDSSCGYPTPASSTDVTLRNPTNGAAAANLSPLTAFAGLTGIDLGGPQTCTPIGDALKSAFEVLNVPPLGDLDAATVMLLTDGYENSGAVSIKSTLPAGTSFVGTSLPATLKAKLALYVIGCGQTVDEDALNNLPAVAGLDLLPSGYYRLGPQVQDLLPTFAQALGNSVDAQDLGAVLDGSSLFATFETNSNEQRLAVVVPWDQPSHSLRLSRRAPGAIPWAPVAIGGATTLSKRDTHALLTVDLVNLLGAGSPAQEWRIEWVNGADVAQPLKHGVLAMVDLFCKMDVAFDKNSYRLGEHIHVTASINAGREVVTGATVIAEVAGPGEGLGTFMAANGAKMAGTATLDNLREGRLIELLHAASHGPDPDQPKAALFNIYLQANGLEALPTVNPLFTDGTDRLFDGAGQAAGVYSNTFARTDKEGTYTLRFRAEGTLADGSHFRRVITISKWVGVEVDPASSPVTFSVLASPPPGMVGQVIVVMPKSKTAEFLGPFRESLVRIEATAGAFTGPVLSRLDGSYERTLLHKPDERPVITVEVDGKRIEPGGDRKGCLGMFFAWVRGLF